MKREKIEITSELRAYLVKIFGVTRKAVYEALTFRSNTEQAQRIRALAKLKGGQHIREQLVNTYHEADDSMVQKFGSRVEIVVWKNTDKTQLYVDGIFREEHEGLTIDAFMSFQKRVQEMADNLK